MDYQRFESELLIDKKGKAKTGTIKFSGELIIQDAAALKESLLEAFSKVNTCKLDLGLVNMYDLSSIQIFYAAHKYAIANNKTLKLAGECPNVFNHAVIESGFGNINWLCFGS